MRHSISRSATGILGCLLAADGGVVQRVYLIGPDGDTVYSFSLWPTLPDETGS